MSAIEVLEKAPTYLSEYLTVAVATLRYPGVRFASPPDVVRVEHSTRAIQLGPSLSPKLLTFVLLSAVLGTTLNHFLLPRGSDRPEFQVAAVFVVLYFVFSSVVAYVLCRLLGGNGSFVDTMSVSLQLLATLYVASSVLAIVISAVLSPRLIGSQAAQLVTPVSIYFSLQLVTLAIYFPMALRPVHALKPLASIALVLLSFLGTTLSLLVYLLFSVLPFGG